MTRTQKLPDASHPITVTPAGRRIRVSVADTVLVDTTQALTLQEADYPPAYYLPRSAIDPALLSPTKTQTYCPFKGDASYVALDLPTGRIEDAAWTYEQPYDAVAEIQGHLAFYPDKVTLEVLSD